MSGDRAAVEHLAEPSQPSTRGVAHHERDQYGSDDDQNRPSE
jgi:hypothetical protein